MTTATLTTERLAEAVGNLIDQFKGQPNIEALVSAWAQQSQDVETAAFGLLTLTTLANAEGPQLDGLGAIVGVERGGKNDTDYRTRIAAQILINNSSGTIEQLLEIAVTMGATTVTLNEVPPAKIELVGGVSLDNGGEIAAAIQAARAAGVGSWFTWFDDTPAFLFDTAGQGLDQGKMGNIA